MNRIIFDTEHMKIMSLFESITHVNAKDIVSEPERLIVIVPQNQASKAVGRSGVNVKRLENALKRKLKIVDFNSDVLEFTKNLIYPSKAKEVAEQNGAIIITSPDLQTRGYLIGRNARQLRTFESIIKRHFPITKLKVV